MSVTKLKQCTAPRKATLAEDLAAEKDAVSRFIGVLKVEQRALKEGFVDSLVQLAQEKSALATELTRLAGNRDRMALASTAGKAGIDPCIAREGGTAAMQIWRELRELAREASQLNRVNGILIDTLMRNNRQMLNMLQATAQRASLYGPDGQTSAYRGGRVLGTV
jgi:flagella synthesis protein FlgN